MPLAKWKHASASAQCPHVMEPVFFFGPDAHSHLWAQLLSCFSIGLVALFPLMKLLIGFAVLPVIIQSVWWPCPSVSLASRRSSASRWAAAIAWEGRHFSFCFLRWDEGSGCARRRKLNLFFAFASSRKGRLQTKRYRYRLYRSQVI